MTEKDKIIQDLQLENDRLIVRFAEFSDIIEEQERRLLDATLDVLDEITGEGNDRQNNPGRDVR